MRISARNQIKGTVIEVKKGATTSHVRVDIGGGQIVTSARRGTAPLRVLRLSNPPPKPGLYTLSLSAGGWVDLVLDGHFLKPKAFSGATDCVGTRKNHEMRAVGEPLRAAGQWQQGRFDLDRDPAIGLGPPGAFTRKPSLLLFSLAISRPAVSRGSQRNGASVCRF